MNVLITGGAGYLGFSLIEKLLTKPIIDKIVVYDNLSRKNFNLFLDKLIKNERVIFFHGDILDSASLSKALMSIDLVFHLAARVSEPERDIDSHFYDQINNWGTAVLINQINKSTVKKVIYASSVYVYGHGEIIHDVHHDSIPSSFYGDSKLNGENQLIKTLNENIELVICRIGNIYGYNSTVRFDVIINRLIFEAIYFNRVKIYGDGSQIRPFINIQSCSDALSGFVATKYKNKIFNIVDSHFSISEILQILLQINDNLEYVYVARNSRMRDLKVIPSTIDHWLANDSKTSLKENILEFVDRIS